MKFNINTISRTFSICTPTEHKFIHPLASMHILYGINQTQTCTCLSFGHILQILNPNQSDSVLNAHKYDVSMFSGMLLFMYYKDSAHPTRKRQRCSRWVIGRLRPERIRRSVIPIDALWGRS